MYTILCSFYYRYGPIAGARGPRFDPTAYVEEQRRKKEEAGARLGCAFHTHSLSLSQTSVSLYSSPYCVSLLIMIWCPTYIMYLVGRRKRMPSNSRSSRARSNSADGSRSRLPPRASSPRVSQLPGGSSSSRGLLGRRSRTSSGECCHPVGPVGAWCGPHTSWCLSHWQCMCY